MIRRVVRTASLVVAFLGLLLIWWLYLLDTEEEWRAHNELVTNALTAVNIAAILWSASYLKLGIPIHAITPRALLMQFNDKREPPARDPWPIRIRNFLLRLW